MEAPHVLYTGGMAGDWLLANAEWAAAFDVYGGMGLNAYGLAAKAAAGGFAGAFVGSGGDAKAGLQGAATGAAFSWAGGIAGEHDPSRYAAHAAVGCGSAIMNGSGCERGAASAVAGHATAGGGIVASVVAGGTVSAIGGGKFANGAVTAGFGYLFNHLSLIRLGLATSALRLTASRPYAFAYDILASEVGLFGPGGAAAVARTYDSFDDFKRVFGPAGPMREWHHVVEQHADNVARFGEHAIHDVSNLVNISAEQHRRISGFYSMIRNPFTGETQRDYIKTLSFEDQRRIGMEALRQTSR